MRTFTLIAALLLAACATPPAPASSRTLTLAGQITRADHQTYREIPFTVPPGVSRIAIELAYDHDQHTVIDLGLRDPSGQRGWSGGNKSRIVISAFDATPSYRAGPLAPGTWTLVLGVPNIREGVTAAYSAKVTFEQAQTSAFLDAPISPKAGWYRGDFHMHTGHSDGSCASGTLRIPCPVIRTLEAAKAAHLDFIAITDHNTLTQAEAMRELQPAFPDLLLIPGSEVTTFYGHANALGLSHPVDFQLGSKRLPTLTRLLDQLAEQNAILSINHPAQPSDESCMGCGWTATTTPADWSRITAVEAVNGASLRVGKAEGGIAFWQKRLSEGYRLTAIGGSDNHDATDVAGEKQSPIGTPATVVWTSELSQQGILAGVRSGRVFIDLTNTPGRSMDVDISTPDATGHMGSTIRLSPGQSANVVVKLNGVDRPGISTYSSGVKLEAFDGGARYEAMLEGGATRGWLRFDVSSAGKPALIGNPVFLERR
jgi:hypothetical protein